MTIMTTSVKKSLIAILSALFVFCLIFVGSSLSTNQVKANDNLNVVTLENSKPADHVEMRLNVPTGMRFVTKISASDLENNEFDLENTTVVTMITPKVYLDRAEIEVEDFDKDSAIRYSIVSYALDELTLDEDGCYTVKAVLLEVKDKNVMQKFVAKTYVTDGVNIGYTDAQVASIFDVANYWLEQGLGEEDEQTQAILDRYGKCEHAEYVDGACSTCGTACKHEAYNTDSICIVCGLVCTHAVYENGKCTGCGKIVYTRDDNYIYFGRYPQTIKASSVTVSSTKNSNGYYLGSDGAEYAKVVATPWSSDIKFTTNSKIQSGTTYYFKVEPIRWKITSESDGTITLLCDSVIANMEYGDDNYKDSAVRKWLNDDYYKKAFNSYEQVIIQTTLVDNSAKSTGYDTNSYASANTNDKIYLLSRVEANKIGLSNLKKKPSDYARATGVRMTRPSYDKPYDYACWWLRSPDKSSNVIQIVNGEKFGTASEHLSEYGGIVPALTIKK